MPNKTRSAKRFLSLGSDARTAFIKRINYEKKQEILKKENNKPVEQIKIKPKKVVVKELMPFDKMNFDLYTANGFNECVSNAAVGFQLLNDEEMEIMNEDGMQMMERYTALEEELKQSQEGVVSNGETVRDFLRVTKYLIMTCASDYMEPNKPNQDDLGDASIQEQEEKDVKQDKIDHFNMAVDNLLDVLPVHVLQLSLDLGSSKGFLSLGIIKEYLIVLALVADKVTATGVTTESNRTLLKLIKLILKLLPSYKNELPIAFFVLQKVGVFLFHPEADIRGLSLHLLLDLASQAPFPFLESVLKHVVFSIVSFRCSARNRGTDKVLHAFLDEAAFAVFCLDGETGYHEMYYFVQLVASKIHNCDLVNPKKVAFTELQSRELTLVLQLMSSVLPRLIKACPHINYKAIVPMVIQELSTLYNYSKTLSLLPLRLICTTSSANFIKQTHSSAPALFVPLVNMVDQLLKTTKLYEDPAYKVAVKMDPSMLYATELDSHDDVTLVPNKDYIITTLLDVLELYTKRFGNSLSFPEQVYYLMQTLESLPLASPSHKTLKMITRTQTSINNAIINIKKDRFSLPNGPHDLNKMRVWKNNIS